MRIGVVADTHVGEHLPALPASVAEALHGVDLVLHAGDLTDPVVLRDLGRVAPVVAVAGNHDEEAGLTGLPRSALVSIGGWRLGLTHGTRSRMVELPAGVASLVRGRPCLLGFARAMRRRFGDVDVVVAGHLHVPLWRLVDGVPVFSPGAVYVPEGDPAHDWRGPRGWALRRFRSGLAPAERLPAVGVIDAGPGGVRARRVALPGTLRGTG